MPPSIALFGVGAEGVGEQEDEAGDQEKQGAEQAQHVPGAQARANEEQRRNYEQPPAGEGDPVFLARIHGITRPFGDSATLAARHSV